MLIEEKKLQHWIDHFYGYGSWQAPIWFVAYEDGGGELPEEVAEKINYFDKVHRAPEKSLCDIRELYKNISLHPDTAKSTEFENRYEYRFGKKSLQSNLWKNLILFAHGYRDEKADALVYQRETFLSSGKGREAMMLLYPLPSPHSHAWYYSWLDAPTMPFLKVRRVYEEVVYEQRINTILSQMTAHKPNVVLMYGMSNINALKHSIQQFFPGAKFKMVKGVKLQFPQHHRAQLGPTTMIITTQIPALRHNRIETGFDWEAFGRMIKSA